MLNRVKNLLSKRLLKCLYFTLIQPYLDYGCILWGDAKKKYLNPIAKLQNKALRIINKVPYNADTANLYRHSRILKVTQLFKLQVCKYMYLLNNKMLNPDLNIFYTSNIDVHNHYTRQRSNLHIPLIRNEALRRTLLFHGPDQWKQLPRIIRCSNNI